MSAIQTPGLIIPDDFPPLDKFPPKPLSPEDDRLLDIELRRNADILSDGLLLLRAMGMRIGECLDLDVWSCVISSASLAALK